MDLCESRSPSTKTCREEFQTALKWSSCYAAIRSGNCEESILPDGGKRRAWGRQYWKGCLPGTSWSRSKLGQGVRRSARRKWRFIVKKPGKPGQYAAGAAELLTRFRWPVNVWLHTSSCAIVRFSFCLNLEHFRGLRRTSHIWYHAGLESSYWRLCMYFVCLL